MTNTEYSIFLKSKEYKIPKKKQIIIMASDRVADNLLLNDNYIVKSNVSHEVFESFLDYWKDKNKIPNITPINYKEYKDLSQEFEIMSDLISSQRNNTLLNISILLNSVNTDTSDIEKIISQQLDLYLDNHFEDMGHIPYQSLYNIFYNENRVLNSHKKAYDFILKTIQNNHDINLYSLISSIDGQILYSESPDAFADSISKFEEHMKNMPKIDQSFLLEKIKPHKETQKKEISDLILTTRFKDLRKKINNEQITFIKIPKNVNDIPNSAFFMCSSLVEVILSKNLKTIGKQAFFLCKSLESIFIPSSVIFIGQSAFSGCSKLTKIEIPNSLKILEEGVFHGCALENISIPSCVEKIRFLAISYCYNLTHLNIPETVTEINCWSLCGNTSLVEVKLPSNIKDTYAIFDGCCKLEKVTLPKNLETIGYNTFIGCSSLKRIDIPSKVTAINNGAFRECISLVEITLPPDLKTLGDGAFFGCKSLEKVNFSNLNSLTIIPSECFKNCSKLNDVFIPYSVVEIKSSAFVSCVSLTHIEIPPSVKEIGGWCFCGCTSLSKVVLPEGYEKFDSCIFAYSNIKEITITASLESAFFRYNCFDSRTKVILNEK